MPLRDKSLVLRSTTPTAFSSANTGALSDALELEGTPLRGLALKVTISTCVSGATMPTVGVFIHASTTTTVPTSDSKIIGQATGLACAATDQYVSYIIPFVDPQARSIKAKVDVTATTGASAWSVATVEVYVVPNVGREWNREVSFH